LPTGIAVRAHESRSYHANRATALERLRARLAKAQRDGDAAARAAERRAQIGSGMRGDKRRTIRVQDDSVVDHLTGRTWRYKEYARGDW
jgi:peptide chain release factor 1